MDSISSNPHYERNYGSRDSLPYEVLSISRESLIQHPNIKTYVIYSQILSNPRLRKTQSTDTKLFITSLDISQNTLTLWWSPPSMMVYFEVGWKICLESDLLQIHQTIWLRWRSIYTHREECVKNQKLLFSRLLYGTFMPIHNRTTDGDNHIQSCHIKIAKREFYIQYLYITYINEF